MERLLDELKVRLPAFVLALAFFPFLGESRVDYLLKGATESSVFVVVATVLLFMASYALRYAIMVFSIPLGLAVILGLTWLARVLDKVGFGWFSRIWFTPHRTKAIADGGIIARPEKPVEALAIERFVDLFPSARRVPVIWLPRLMDIYSRRNIPSTQDQTEQLDLSVQMAVVAAIAFVAYCLFDNYVDWLGTPAVTTICWISAATVVGAFIDSAVVFYNRRNNQSLSLILHLDHLAHRNAAEEKGIE